jgi:hypothetical protein
MEPVVMDQILTVFRTLILKAAMQADLEQHAYWTHEDSEQAEVQNQTSYR